jgi:cysteine desulfurase
MPFFYFILIFFQKSFKIYFLFGRNVIIELLMIYFDNAASTKPRKESVAALNAAISENFANPSALHKGGIEAEKLITAAKVAILSHLPRGGDLIFTSGATESNNLAICGSVKSRSKSRIVTTAIEHPSVGNLIADKSGEVCGDTALLSMTAVCGETGFVSEIPEVPPDCLLHIDAAQAFGKIPLVSLNADLISISAHKIGGIAGVGALWVRKGVRVLPMLHGGGQQRGLRSGTEPTALIAAFGAAAAAVGDSQHDCRPLCDRLTARLHELGQLFLRRKVRGHAALLGRA